MRDINRLDSLYDFIKEEHKKLPDWRFMQLMQNFMDWFYMKYKMDTFYLEDSRFKEYFKEFMKEVLG